MEEIAPLTVVSPDRQWSGEGIAGRETTGPRLPLWAYALGLLGILAAIAGSGMLTAKHLFNIPLPGCGGGSLKDAGSGLSIGVSAAESACATLEAKPLGSLGGMWAWVSSRLGSMPVAVDKVSPEQAVWPVSFLGLTYFLAALAAWMVIGVQGRGVPRFVVWVGRAGVLVSVAYIVAIVATRSPCPYCIASHMGNLTLWLALEIGMKKAHSGAAGIFSEARHGVRAAGRVIGPLLAAIGVFCISSASLATLETRRLSGLRAADAAERSAAKREMQEKMAKDQAAAASQASKGEQPPWPAATGFRGRWILGPKQSQVRVVMLTDFQCPDCRSFEAMAMQSLEKYKDRMSLSLVHFPMCSECNQYVSKTMHENACRAARAAEAAAIIIGSKAELEGQDRWTAANDAFWKMARWLFEVKGEFKDDTLAPQLAAMGITDTAQFMKVMDGPATLKLVQDDTRWGEALGLFYTPMMFVNGVEVRGWLTNPQALTSMIDAAAGASPAPPVMDAHNDNPPLAGVKYIEDWKKAPRLAPDDIPADRVKGPADAKVRVVVYGDRTEPSCKKADAAVMELMKTKKFSYAFRSFPVCKACNPGVDDRYPMGCLAAEAVEAAAVVGGAEGYWKMHGFIFQKAESLSPTLVGLGAGFVGLDSAKFDAALASPGVKKAVIDEVNWSRKYVTRFVPTVVVDGKVVDRWQRDNDNVLEKIIDYALEHPGQ